MEKIPFINIKAKNPSDFGLQLGKALRKQIQKRLSANKQIYLRMGAKDFAGLVKSTQKFLPDVQKYFPEYLEEARAMAKGAEIPFEEMLVMICEEELLDFKIPHCTTLAIKAGGEILLGHNEDWLQDYLENGLVMIKGEIGRKKFLTLSYIGSLAGSSCAVTSAGLAFSGNSLNSGRFRYGVPKNFHMRALLEAESLNEAVYEDEIDETIATNSLLVWKNTKMLDLEIFFAHQELFSDEVLLVHTNHPLLKKEQTLKNTSRESVKRLNRALELLSRKTKYSENDLKVVLKDHVAGICGHSLGPKSTYGVTIASAIMNPHQGWMEVSWGNPCKNGYKKYLI